MLLFLSRRCQKKRPTPSRRGFFGLPVLLLLAGYTAIFYWRAFASGVISDGWVLLEIGSRGLARAPFAILSYHAIPVANLFIAILWKLFGLKEPWYQLLNLAELTTVGWLLYRLGRHLFAEARIGLLASLLFLSNSSFYDVPLWPVVGNFHSLSALLYLAALFAVHRAVRSARPATWVWSFALASLAAFFTYEPAVSVLAAGLFYAVLVPVGAAEPGGGRTGLARARLLAPALLTAAAVILASKVWAAAAGHTALIPPNGLEGLVIRLYLLVRACIALFSLRGADPALYAVFSFGSFTPIGTRAFHAFLGAWLLVLTGSAAILVWKAREPTVRLLVLWLAAHLLAVSAGVDIVSRHFYLAALPASLLTSWALWRGADRMASALARLPSFDGLGMSPSQAGAVLVLPIVTLLAAGARTDLDSAAAVHLEATQATRQITDLVHRRLLASAAPPRVVLVNMPAILIRDGMAAFTFGNGLTEQLRLTTAGRVYWPLSVYTRTDEAPGTFADKSQPITLSGLSALVRDPGVLVLMFDPRSRTVVELDRQILEALVTGTI